MPIGLGNFLNSFLNRNYCWIVLGKLYCSSHVQQQLAGVDFHLDVVYQKLFYLGRVLISCLKKIKNVTLLWHSVDERYTVFHNFTNKPTQTTSSTKAHTTLTHYFASNKFVSHATVNNCRSKLLSFSLFLISELSSDEVCPPAIDGSGVFCFKKSFITVGNLYTKNNSS